MLLVKAVAAGTVVGGLEETDFVVEVERADADARHGGDLFDGVGHVSPARLVRSWYDLT